MFPFEDVLGQVRRSLEGASQEDVLGLLGRLMEAQVLSQDYCRSLALEADAEDLVRRISLPIWQNWEACHGRVSPLLHQLQPEPGQEPDLEPYHLEPGNPSTDAWGTPESLR
ncbi:hypothetical protein JZ751_006311 [Albula glossodonta]|uniref:Uncharacterized protein n=1 Tax=Albula glossodonta TaxID=121402 RepID=A0A8T2N4F8_9TELE|nr:hypothetical protein JZ751_006311 [Albula glossodonta]